MLRIDRWAAAFINSLGAEADTGLQCLKALAAPVKPLRGALFGRTVSLRLERTLRESAAAAGFPPSAPAVEYPIRFIMLLVERSLFRSIDTIITRIEQRLDERNGILDVTAESAAPVDDAFIAELRQAISAKTGAAGIRLETRIRPELLGGYRLRIGGLRIDASLQGQMEQIAAELTSAAIGQPLDA